jgi:hypothetical protein
MSENTAVENNSAVESANTEVVELEEFDLHHLVSEVTKLAEGTEYTAYRIATIINKVFVATGTVKEIPTQMMYIYTNKGMIAKRTKGQSAKDVRYTYDEVVEFVHKYTNKYV